MVRDEVAPVSAPTVRQDGVRQGQPQMSWGTCNNSGNYGVDPVQDAAMHMGYYGTIDENHWNFDGYR
jgi:hypothetical protein